MDWNERSETLNEGDGKEVEENCRMSIDRAKSMARGSDVTREKMKRHYKG